MSATTTGTARAIGVLYLAANIPAPFNLLYVPGRFVVPGDATTTAQNIAAGELTYRIGLLCGLVYPILWVFLIVSLYSLLKDVDRKQARLMVLLASIMITLALVNLLNQMAPLLLPRRADATSAFTKPQLDVLAYAFLRLWNGGNGIAAAFMGLWLLPFGILVWKSGVIPKVIGVLLIVGCVGYLAQCLTVFLWPRYTAVVFNYTVPLVAPGEMSIVAWLLIKGGRVSLPDSGTAGPAILSV